MYTYSILNKHTAPITMSLVQSIYLHGVEGNNKCFQRDFQHNESKLITPCASENGFG